MTVIINDLEIVMDAKLDEQASTGQAAPEKPAFGPQELMAVLQREQRDELRLMAH